jgi:hypothetical protein
VAAAAAASGGGALLGDLLSGAAEDGGDALGDLLSRLAGPGPEPAAGEGQSYEDYKASLAVDPKEGQFDELVDYAHYVCVNEMRQAYADEGEADEQEALFAIAHFLLRNGAWDPYKQSLLALTLIEKVDGDARAMWDRILTPLEKAYEATSGEGFKNRFGFTFRAPAPLGSGGGGSAFEGGSKGAVTATRMHAEQVLVAMARLAKEAGQHQNLPSEERSKGVPTPRDTAEREARAKAAKTKGNKAGPKAGANPPDAKADAKADAKKAAKRAAVEARVAEALAARKAELTAAVSGAAASGGGSGAASGAASVATATPPP